MVGKGGLPVPGGEAPGGIGPPGFPNRQIHKGGVRRNQVQSGFGAGLLAITSDAQAYKQAGNSVTVNVIEAIGRRIRAVDEQLRREDAAA